MVTISKLGLLLVVLTACRSIPQAAPFAATLAQTVRPAAAVSSVSTAVPTADLSTWTPTPTPTPTATFTPSNTPTATITDTSTPTATLTTTLFLSATPLPSEVVENVPTWTPPPDNPATRIDDHYRLTRPIADGLTNWVDRTYPYGGTAGGRLQVHHGVEFVNPRGTVILAAGNGTVIHAGTDGGSQYGPQTNYYGNLVVIQHDFTAPDGAPVFTLYGHMQTVDVATGQRIERGKKIGTIGDSGIAQGPHLHFEVRVGDPFNFGATRNPELWIRPYFKFGTLAGRVTDANGTVLQNVTVQVKSTDIQRYGFSYAGNSVNGDSQYGENFTLGDLPANYYEVSVTDNGRVRFQETVYVYPDRTTWVDIQLRP